MASELQRQRLALGLGAIVSVDHASRLLPIADRDARRWLKQRGLVRLLDGRPVVCWVRVVEALDAHPPDATRDGASPSPASVRLPRTRIARLK